jgi:hypothetical protein
MVLRFVAIGLLVANQGNEEAKLGYLDSDGLDVDAIEAILDKVELAAIVIAVLLEVALDGFPRRVARRAFLG